MSTEAGQAQTARGGSSGREDVASSRPRGNGLFKIDILAEDGDRRPSIIECKHDLVDAAAWSQLRRYRDALKEGWAEAAPRFGGGASREPVLVAIGYRFDRSVDADEVVRLAYRYHDVKLGADEVQTQTVGRVSLHPILGAADESAQRHPKVSKKNATVERLQRFAPHLAEEFWTVDAELRSLPGVKERSTAARTSSGTARGGASSLKRSSDPASSNGERRLLGRCAAAQNGPACWNSYVKHTEGGLTTACSRRRRAQ